MMKKTFSPEEKERILLKARKSSSIGDLCQEEGISRTTFYYWKRNYEKEGLAGLRRRSTKRINNDEVASFSV